VCCSWNKLVQVVGSSAVVGRGGGTASRLCGYGAMMRLVLHMCNVAFLVFQQQGRLRKARILFVSELTVDVFGTSS